MKSSFIGRGSWPSILSIVIVASFCGQSLAVIQNGVGQTPKAVNPSRLAAQPADILESLPAAIKKVFDASEADFASLKGTPLLGQDKGRMRLSSPDAKTGVVEFKTFTLRWIPALLLPGGERCLITQDENQGFDSAGKVVMSILGPAEYQCFFRGQDPKQLFLAIESGLGPAWEVKTSGNVVSFSQVGAKIPEPRIVLAATAGAALVSITGSMSKQRPAMYTGNPNPDTELGKLLIERQAVERKVQDEQLQTGTDVKAAIRRIEASDHSSLPPLSDGVRGGPITIQNDTGIALTVYLWRNRERSKRRTVRPRRDFVRSW